MNLPMNLPWLQNTWMEVLGWTLLHSLWQLSLIAMIAGTLLLLLRRRSSQLRYLAAYACLIAMAAAPVATYAYLWSRAPHAGTTSPAPLPPNRLGPAPLSVTTGINSFLSQKLPAPTFADRLTDSLRPLLPYASLLYLVSTSALTLRLLFGYHVLRRLRAGGLPASNEHLAILTSLQKRLRFLKPIRLLQSASVEVPTVLGVLRPIILLPATALTGLSSEHLTYLLLHELAHIRRHDYAANLLQSIIETLLFYHPAVLWISAQVRQEREHCCDDLAISMLGNRRAYTEALTWMETLRSAPRHVPESLALGARGGSLIRRVRRILEIPMPTTSRNRVVSATSILLTVCILGLVSYLIGCRQTGATSADSPAEGQKVTRTTVKVPQDGTLLVGGKEMHGVSEITIDLPNPSALPGSMPLVIVDLNVHEQPWKKVLQDLCAAHDVNLFVNSRALQTAGIAEDTAISHNLHRVSLDKAVATILSSVDERLVTQFDGNVLTITTGDDLEKAEHLLTKVYDVRDLLIPRDSTKTSLRLGDRASELGVPDAPLSPEVLRSHIIETLENAITSTVAPNSWTNNGGTGGSIKEFQGHLLITQTAKNHEQIANLLLVLRRANELEVRVEAHILLLDDAAYKSLHLMADSNGQTQGVFLNPDEIKALLKKIAGDPTIISIASPRIQLFSGDNASIQTGHEEAYVAECKTKTDEKGKVVPDYELQKVKTGVTLGIEAAVSADRKFVITQLHPIFRTLMRMDKFPAPNVPIGPEFFIQKPVVEESDMSTRVAIPDDATCVLTGITSMRNPLEGQPDPKKDDAKARHLVLLVRPHIVLPSEADHK